MLRNEDPGMEALVNPTCTLAAVEVPMRLHSGSDVSLPINSRPRDSQAQRRKSTSFLEPIQPAKNGRKESRRKPWRHPEQLQALAEEQISSL